MSHVNIWVFRQGSLGGSIEKRGLLAPGEFADLFEIGRWARGRMVTRYGLALHPR